MSRGKIDPLLQHWLEDRSSNVPAQRSALRQQPALSTSSDHLSKPEVSSPLTDSSAVSTEAILAKHSDEFSQDALESVGRYSISLSDSEPSARKRALIAIQVVLSDPRLAPKAKQDCFQLVLKPLLKRFADSQERCREIAVALVDEFVKTTQDIVPWLSFIIPVVGYRFSEPSQKETSEELRIALVRLVFEVLSSLDALPLSERERFYPYLMGTVSVLEQCACDSAPEVVQNACLCLCLCCKVAAEPMHAYSVKTIKTVMPLLSHKHAKVRVSAIETMRALVPLGAAECIRDLCAFQESNVVNLDTFFTGEFRTNYMGKLVSDEQFKVRWSFYSMVCDWMAHLPERYDYETLIMPYVLSGLGDDATQIQQLAFETIHSIGAQYEIDNEDQLKDELEYDSEVGGLTWKGQSALPPPFTGRPGLGSRIIVKRFVPRLIHAILNELADWKAATRERTMLLLQALVIYGEEQFTQHAHKLVSVLSSAKLWQEVSVRSKLRQCLQLLARFVHPDAIVPNLILALEAENNWDAGSSGSALVETLKTLFGSFPPQRLAKQTASLIEFLSSGDLLSSRSGSSLTAASELIECVWRAIDSMRTALSAAGRSDIDTLALVGERKDGPFAPSFLTAHKTVPVTEESLKSASDDAAFLSWQLAAALNSLEREASGKTASVYRSILDSFTKSISAFSTAHDQSADLDSRSCWPSLFAAHADYGLCKLSEDSAFTTSAALVSTMLEFMGEHVKSEGVLSVVSKDLLKSLATRHSFSAAVVERLQHL